VLDEGSKRQVRELCDRIAKEHNGERFALLVAELNRVFDTADIGEDGDRRYGGSASGEKTKSALEKSAGEKPVHEKRKT